MEAFRSQVRSLLRRERFVLERAGGRYGLLGALFAFECASPRPDLRRRESLAAQEAFQLADIGLAMEAGVEDASGRAVDDGLSAWAGLSWDLLNRGLRENRSRAERLRLRRAVDALKAQGRRNVELYECRDDALLRHFLLLRRQELDRRQEILQQFRAFVRQAYFTGEELLDPLLRIEGALYAVKSRLTDTELLVDRLPVLPGAGESEPPLLALDIDQLQRAAAARSRDALLSRLQERIVDLEYDALDDVTLRLYARAGIDADNGDEHMVDDRVAVGLRFRAPITWRNYDQMRLAAKRTLAAKAALERQRRVLEMTRRVHAYREKLQDAFRLLHTRQVIAERLRRSLLLLEENRTGRANLRVLRDMLQQLDEYYDNRAETLAVKEALYRRLLLLFTDLGITPEPRFFRAANSGLPYARARLGHRGVYLWSSAINKLEPEDIVWFCVTKSIDRVFVSLGRRTDDERLAALLKRCREQGIQVVPMASNTAWIEPASRPAIQRFFDRLPPETKLVHLDIEPQTRPDFRQRRQEYHRRYVAMLAWIAEHKPAGVAVDIAAPVWWSAEEVAAVAPYADSLTVMAYGTRDAERLRQRLASFAAVEPRRIAVALRPTDFQDEAELERFVDRLVAISPYRRFLFHDFARYLSLIGASMP